MNKTKISIYIVMLFSLSSCQAQNNSAVKIHRMPEKQKNFHISTKNEDNLIPFHNTEGKWGYLDAQTDSVVISARYADADLFKKGIARVYEPNPHPRNWEERQLIGFIDTKGRVIFKPQFAGIYDVEVKGNQDPENSLANLRSIYTADGTSGVINLKTGQFLFTVNKDVRIFFYNRTHFVVDYHTFYHDGKATTIPERLKISKIDFSPNYIRVYNEKGASGLYSWEGKEIIPPKYLNFVVDSAAQRIVASRLRGGNSIANLKRLSRQGNQNSKDIVVELFDLKGNKIKSYDSHYQGDIVDNQTGYYQIGQKTVYFSLKTGELIKERKKVAQKLPGRDEIFQKNEKTGLRSADGKVIIPPEYRRITYNKETQLLIAETNGLHHIAYNLQGKNVFGKTYFEMTYLPELKRFMVSDNEGAGQIDPMGKIVIPLKYGGFSSFSLTQNPPYAVSKNNKHGIIDGEGKTIVPFDYDDIQDTRILDSTQVPFFILTKNEKVGLMDENGKWLLPMNYGYIYKRNKNHNDHWFKLEAYPRNENKIGLFNSQTKTLIPPTYDNIGVYDDLIIATNRKGNTYFHQLLDLSGHPLTKQVYTHMELKYGYFLCRKDGEYGILNTKGETLIPLKYKYIWARTDKLIYVQDEQNDSYYMSISGKAYREPSAEK